MSEQFLMMAYCDMSRWYSVQIYPNGMTYHIISVKHNLLYDETQGDLGL